MEWLFGGNITFTIPKYAENPKDPLAIQLATSLQYSQATGPPAFPKFLRQYVETVLKPGFADWDVLLDDGATDGFGKVCHMLLELGDTVLVEEWTYPGAINTYAPFETNVVALQMDGEGVLPAHMESVLANWDESQGRRPRLFYTVPTGQNPTGATMMAKRKKEIYDICSKYDVVIVEDEPYYTLFVGDYIPKGSKATPLVQHQIDAEKKDGKEGNEAFIKALPPSYLRFDTDGRVIRLDVSCISHRRGEITATPICLLFPVHNTDPRPFPKPRAPAAASAGSRPRPCSSSA
jgi:aromatic amino acid aminotransferase I